MQEARLGHRSFAASLAATLIEAMKYHPVLACLCRPYESATGGGRTAPDERRALLLPDDVEDSQPDTPLRQVLKARRSNRDYSGLPITLAELAILLGRAAGCTRDDSLPYGARRPYPSGGALYPVKLHCLAQRVEGASRSAHEFDPFRRALVPGSPLAPLESSLARYFRPTAAAVVLLAVRIGPQYAKYEELSLKLALLEAGHAAQNLVLVATALGLRSATLCYFDDDLVNELACLDGVESFVCYAVEVGR